MSDKELETNPHILVKVVRPVFDLHEDGPDEVVDFYKCVQNPQIVDGIVVIYTEGVTTMVPVNSFSKITVEEVEPAEVSVPPQPTTDDSDDNVLSFPKKD